MRALRIASVPSGHVYVRHLLDPEAVGAGDPETVRLLPDPDPDDPRELAGARWWPPAMLEAGWVREHADEFDLLQIHFGFDARTPEELRELVEALREAGRPLVMTVHDLRNPHHEERALHDAQLDVLIPAAAQLVTLTPGAAREIERRWGRRAVVLPHPHVVDPETMRRVAAERAARLVERHPSPDDRPFTVGLHLKSRRANMAPLPVLRALIPAVAELPGAVLRVDGHRDLLEPGGARYDAELAGLLGQAEAEGSLELVVHDYFSDDELWGYLAGLDVSVLPYRFGTHSGWLEACRDLGTRVIAPSCGFYAEQGPVVPYRHDEDGLDAGSLRAAVHAAHAAGPAAPPNPELRLAERRRIAAAQEAVWRAALETAPTSSPPDAAPLAWDAALRELPEAAAPIDGSGSVLVVAAHPDDETIGTGRLMAEAGAAGVTVTAICLSAGEACAPGGSRSPAELARTRLDEWRAALAELGATAAATPRFPDGALAEAPPEELADAVADAARDVRATMIWTVWRGDPHPDHAAAGEAARAAAERLGIPLLEYPVWAMTWRRPDELAAAGVELAAIATGVEAERRRDAALGAYASQLQPLKAGWPPVVPAVALARHARQLVVRERPSSPATAAGPGEGTALPARDREEDVA